MKDGKGIISKSVGKTTASAVLTMTAVIMTVMSGCQTSGEKETAVSAEHIQADAGGIDTEQLSVGTFDREQMDAEQSGTDYKPVGTETAETRDEMSANTGTGARNGGQHDTEPGTVTETQGRQSGVQTREDSGAPDRKQPPADFELTLASEDWGLSFGEAGTQPRGNALPEDLAWYDAYYVGSDSEKVIYLTFDCGYENGNTEPILDALQKHNVKATFFVVGHFLETAPELVKRMAAEGHAVGNHTYHHLDMPSISDEETFRQELDDVADLFREITGTELSHYYRPPQGKCNAGNLKTAYDLGYKTIFWSLAYVDWNQDDQPGRTEALDKLTSRVHPGAVVLLHNTSSTNGEILDELLTKWEEMGYAFRPLSELTEF